MRLIMLRVLAATGLFAALFAFAASPAAAVPVPGTIEATDPDQTGRLTRAGGPATCAALKANPGLFEATGIHNYDSYTYQNTSGVTQCVTVTVAFTGGGGRLHAVAYLGSFNPADPSANYLADSGLSVSAQTLTQTFSFNLAAGATVVVVVSEVGVSPGTDSCVGCTYTLDITAAPATSATFRSASATSTTKGVVVRWKTAAELQMLGFNVYRQVGAQRIRVNTKLIAAKGRGSYSFLDRKAPKAKTVRYWVQVVNLDGTRSWYGPARVARS